MKEVNLVKLCNEAERYPGLLATLQLLQSAEETDLQAQLSQWLVEEPEDEGVETAELFDRYVERGEIGGAQFLLKLRPDLPSDKLIRRKSQLTQQVADALLNARDSLLQIKESNSQLGEAFAAKLDRIDSDPVLMSYRHGFVLRMLQAICSELEVAIAVERERVGQECKALIRHSAGNADVEMAVKRIEEFINVPEGLASAARMLNIGKRAANGTMSADDITMLYSTSGEGVRLIRPWGDIRLIVGECNSPAALAEKLYKEEFAKALRLPAEFDREKLRDLLIALTPDATGAINTERVADKLEGFLGLYFIRPQKIRGAYGTHFPFSISAARHREFSGIDRKFYMTIPLRGTDPSAIGQLFKELAANNTTKALSVLVYPNIADASRGAAQQIGVTQAELLFIDCIDLLRIAEVPVARRVIALQQILLPRMPSLGTRTYQTGGPVASELFRGRQSIIEELTRARGKTVLFSGRMMGKSSVLSRIRERIEQSKGGEPHQCVLLSAATGSLLEPLMERLFEFILPRQKEEVRKERDRLVATPQDNPTQRERKELQQLALLRKTIEQIIQNSRLTILIDEADTFAKIDSAKDRRVSLGWLLRDVENHSPEKLRIVFAGFQTLHHEVIAANGAFANWFGLCQLGPLDREEAISLIREPLADFGVHFMSEAGIERILEFTGRYPLLIQEVCDRLMKRAMARRQQPVKPGDELVTVRAGEVEVVCRAEALRTRLHQVLSLNLDQYPRLKLVTYLILQAGTYRAPQKELAHADVFKIEDVQSMLVDWYGERLSEYFSDTSLPGLVEELGSLGLVAAESDGYRFLNRTFAAMLRDNPNFENDLQELLLQVANPKDNEPRRYWSLPKEHLEALLRSKQHILIVGLPTTLKSQIVKTLFAGQENSSSFLLSDSTITDTKSVEGLLRQRLSESRKTLSLGDLCVKAKIKVLVLDCSKLPLDEIEIISKKLADRDIRLVATGDSRVVRDFVARPLQHFEIIALRRLRPQDVQAFGESPYRKQTENREYALVIDQKTATALMAVTCGYFPLLWLFREHCKKVMTSASEYYPSEDQVEGFRKELSQKQIRELLLSSLTDIELSVLRSLLDQAKSFEPERPRIDRELAQEQLLDESENDAGLTEKLNAVEVLLLLDLISEVSDAGRKMYVFDNAGLLSAALSA
jgi:hypothetical protein